MFYISDPTNNAIHINLSTEETVPGTYKFDNNLRTSCYCDSVFASDGILL